MPQRQKSVRKIVAEVVMYIGLAAVVGQIAANFWERFMIQAELANMKSSLHSLKFTVNNIGTAYDNLHKDLKNLLTTTERKASEKLSKAPPSQYNSRNNFYKCKPEDVIEVRAAVEPKRGLDVATDFERTMRDFIQECKMSCKNVSTLTRYPLKSTAVGKDEEFKVNPPCYHFHKFHRHSNDHGKIKPCLRCS